MESVSARRSTVPMVAALAGAVTTVYMGVQFLVGFIVGVAVLVASWFFIGRGPQAVLRRHLPTIYRLRDGAAYLLPLSSGESVDASLAEVWTPEVERFTENGRRFWKATKKRFGKTVIDGHKWPSGVFDHWVEERLAWPDDVPPEGDTGPGYAHRIFGTKIEKFCTTLYRTDPGEIDDYRSEMAKVLDLWYPRLHGVHADQFQMWLGDRLRIHLPTIKLLWYMELANAATIPSTHGKVDSGAMRAVREAIQGWHEAMMSGPDNAELLSPGDEEEGRGT